MSSRAGEQKSGIARTLTVAFALVAAFVGVCGNAAANTTYEVNESLICSSGGCSGSLGLTGSITVDQLGSLSAANIVGWNLEIGNSVDTPVTLTQSNSAFTAVGAVQIAATASALTFALAVSTDGFEFDDTSTGASWIYGNGGTGAQLLIYPNPNGGLDTGFQTFTLPNTLTLPAFGAARSQSHPHSRC